MMAAAAAMAISAGMHMIPSARFTPPQSADPPFSLYRHTYRKVQPTSQIDLADRIYALYVMVALH